MLSAMVKFDTSEIANGIKNVSAHAQHVQATVRAARANFGSGLEISAAE